MRVAGIAKTSLVDFPPYVAATVFTPGCNFRCGFCHNASLVEAPPAAWGEAADAAAEAALEELARRSRFLDAVCVTGGEPTLQPGLSTFLARTRALGLRTKVDTNGSNPAVIRALLDASLVDHVAVDVKAAPDRYREVAGDAADPAATRETVELLRSRGVSHELRWTAAPGFCADADADRIADYFGGASPFFLQPFRSVPGCLGAAFREAPPSSIPMLEALARRLAPRFMSVTVRA